MPSGAVTHHLAAGECGSQTLLSKTHPSKDLTPGHPSEKWHHKE